jgi:hypothetical protein
MTALRNDAESLKLAFPEAVLALESERLQNSLTGKLKFQAVVNVDETKADARIQLNDGYFLILKPDFTGYNGVNFWFKWNTFRDSETGEERFFYQFRCLVELHQALAGEATPSRIISFGIEASAITRAIDRAIAKIAEMQGLRLVPLPIVEIN